MPVKGVERMEENAIASFASATNVDFKPAHWMDKDAIASSGFHLLRLSRSNMMHQAATAPVLRHNLKKKS